MTLSVAEVMAAMERHYPSARAEEWDRVGLAVGDRSASIERALLAVDVTSAVLAEAEAVGAQLIIAHHPPLLKPLHAIDSDEPKGRLILAAARAGISIYAAHTNADKPARGVSAALARAVGLVNVRPLLPDPIQLITLTAYVDAEHAERVRTALAEAGAGAIGDYDTCSFSSAGTGRFRPLPGSEPFIGTSPGRLADAALEEVDEVRIEVIAPRRRRAAVVTALLAAHPYQTPAYHLTEFSLPDPDSGLGRVGELAEPMTATQFAQVVARALPKTLGGVRIGGNPDRRMERVALLGGAGDSMLDAARTSGADGYLTSDLRHHPASEALEWARSPVLFDVAHWAAEWTWLPELAELLGAECPALDVVVSTKCTDPWTALVNA